MIDTRVALLVFFATTAAIQAAEPQWIWSHKDAASKAEAGQVAFRKAFNVEGSIESATVTLSADNAFDLFLNGRHVGSGEGWASRFRFDVKPLLIPGRNILAIRATNAGADPAGLAVQVEIKPQGKDAVQIASDDSWKFATKLLGNWARPEFDDSKWENAAALGEYGKTAPWGAAGQIVQGQAAANADKPRNTERGLFEFKDGDRLVLLGSAFIERMQANGYFELELISAFPDKNITVRNLGWSGDNVWGDARAVFGSRADGFKRLMSDVKLCDPTVILVCYGENEAYAGEAGLDEFRDGFETLLDNLEKTGARLVIATPRKHENVGKPFSDQTKYNADLRKYCDAMKKVAKQREHTFVDWFDLLDRARLTENGIHLSPYGYHAVAMEQVGMLGGAASQVETLIDLDRNIISSTGRLLTDVKLTKTHVSFTAQSHRHAQAPILAEHLSQVFGENAKGQSFPGFSHHLVRETRIVGLAPGKYELLIDGTPGYEGNAETLTEGILEGHDEASEKLLAAINEKNFLFFNRYRPQNETYLFLFRKHEQGNNAAEIPQFDPLIAEQEKIIAELKKPPKQKFELRQVGG